jgi:hypothetical protein
VIALAASPAGAATIPGMMAEAPSPASLSNPVCNPATCDLIEGNLVILPFIAFSGDVILLDPDGTVSDVARFFNNIVDTGGGTGLGNQVLVFSKIDSGADSSVGPDLGLPPPSSYSSNAVTIQEAPDGFATDYNGNGTIYHIYSDVPEPSGAALVGIGLIMLGPLARRTPLRRR